MTKDELDKYYMNIAKGVAVASPCLSRKVGVVLVRNSHILATAYNDFRKGEFCGNECKRRKKEYKTGEHYEDCSAIHAEQNAILAAAWHGIPTVDHSYTHETVMYCTLFPCAYCIEMIAAAGIATVCYGEEWPGCEPVRDLAKRRGVSLVKVEI
jgi:dCMP deaminase